MVRYSLYHSSCIPKGGMLMGATEECIKEGGKMAQYTHDIGMCDEYCPHCYEEKTPEERFEYGLIYGDLNEQ